LTSMGRSFLARRLYRVQKAPASFTAMFIFSVIGTVFALIMKLQS
jgi:sigma54-dependent transcription regulator